MGSELLGSLESELARELLLRALKIAQSEWKAKEKAAIVVVELLESHTLAIIQAAAYIRQRFCSLEQYPTIFQQQKEQLMKFHSPQNLSVYSNVYATFEVSAEYIQKSDNLDALSLLHTLAFIHNSEISETIFQRASNYAFEIRNGCKQDGREIYSLSMSHLERVPGYNQRGSLHWRKACAILESLSIVTMDEDNDSITLSMHSLVHAWAKQRQDQQTRCRMWQSAATILTLSCEGHYRFDPIFRTLQIHVRSCVNHEIEDYTQSMSEMEAAQIFFQLAYFLYRTDDAASLSLLVQSIRSRLENRNDIHQEIILEIKIFIGRVLQSEGNYAGAVDFYNEVFMSRAQTLAEDHPDRLGSQLSLATAYRSNGQIVKAIELLEHVVKIRNNLDEADHDRLSSQRELASAYMHNGQIIKAVKLLEHIVQIQNNLGNDHPDQLSSQHVLAIAYRENRQYDKAIELLEQVVEINADTLTENHSDRLCSQHELAVAYRDNREYDKAIELLEQVVEIQADILAKDHPERLTSQHELAVAYRKNKQYKKAIELFEQVVEIRVDILPKAQFSRLLSQHELAVAYRETKQYNKAIELFEQVVEIRVDILTKIIFFDFFRNMSLLLLI